MSPKREPEPGSVPLQDQNQDVGRRDPEKLVKRIHRDEGAHHEEARRNERRQRRQPLGEAPPAKLPGYQSREDHHQRAGQGGQEAGKGGNQGHEGREIHVAQGQALTGGHVVELVPEVAVVAVGEQMHQELEGSQVGQDRRSAEPTSSPQGSFRLGHRLLSQKVHGAHFSGAVVIDALASRGLRRR
jgi:hypothetical protein